MKSKVLFVCVQNTARSQMAEAWLNHLCGDVFEAKSAGFEPGVLSPLVVEAMAEVGIDISEKKTKSVFDLFKAGAFFGYVIGVCDRRAMEKCPIFPAPVKRIDWEFSDPLAALGSSEARMEAVREVRDRIRARVEEWCAEYCPVQVA
jgi:arsenate reductase (thioredoxin)